MRRSDAAVRNRLDCLWLCEGELVALPQFRHAVGACREAAADRRQRVRRTERSRGGVQPGQVCHREGRRAARQRVRVEASFAGLGGRRGGRGGDGGGADA
eukprot:2494427-Prymnesium_polylepis.1